MKRIVLGIFIIAVMILVGCNNVLTNKQINTSTITDEKKSKPGNQKNGTTSFI